MAPVPWFKRATTFLEPAFELMARQGLQDTTQPFKNKQMCCLAGNAYRSVLGISGNAVPLPSNAGGLAHVAPNCIGVCLSIENSIVAGNTAGIWPDVFIGKPPAVCLHRIVAALPGPPSGTPGLLAGFCGGPRQV